ncbi:MAG: hypothetical protein ACRDPJ_19815 [Nocardioidaceae bacterium]
MCAHSNVVLTLIAVAAGDFATTIKTSGGPGAPLVFATGVASFTATPRRAGNVAAET